MKFSRLSIPDIVLCEPTVYTDSRGYFLESFKLKAFEEFIGHNVTFIQDNESLSNKGVLRGFHYQIPPYAQSKLVRVISGRVLDVNLDIRVGSPTFGKTVAVELSGQNKKQLFVPRGFAHAFLVLEDNTVFSYKVDADYHAQSERGILYSDPAVSFDWQSGSADLILSDKDNQLPCLEHNADLFSYMTNYYA